SAADVFAARDLILQHEPDLMTLDLEMPGMDGLTFLGKVMEHRPMPVIIVSALTEHGSAAGVKALQLGAIDVIPKPGVAGSMATVAEAIVQRVAALRARPFKLPTSAAARDGASTHVPARPTMRHAGSLILIGASTGGTQAIESLLTRLPADAPPILIVQHMPASFTKAFAARLNDVCALQVAESKGGELLQAGHVYVAPGGHHMVVERVGTQLHVALRGGPAVHYQRPAVDVLFLSASKLRHVRIVGIVLTGMGHDGADGLLALRQAGAQTIAEDEQSCVVYGMPKEAIARGGAQHVATLLQMPQTIADCLEQGATCIPGPVTP
ncbi:MAG: chemotaxis response regulator protein-glutamate methylesterase, partial [Vicinamibacterales bacterium]